MGRTAHPSERQLNVARRVANGQSRRQAMIEEGYAESTAERSLKSFRNDVPGMIQAFAQVAEELALTPKQMREIAEYRLVSNVVRGRDRATQSVRLLGELKGYDWFPRTGVSIDVQFAQTIAPIVQELAAEAEKKDS